MTGTGRQMRDRIDPEVRRAVDAFHDAVGPDGLPGIADLNLRRARLEDLAREARNDLPPVERVEHEDYLFDREGAAIEMRVYRPVGAGEQPLPGILYIHGGGMNLGSIESEESAAEALTEEVGCVTASVGYRLAPEHEHPVPFEDCFAGLLWVADNHGRLGIDPGRIAVFGASAGGGLAAAVALAARDRGGPEIAFQALIYPMLDDRLVTASSLEILNIGIWDRSASAEAWQHLLGDKFGSDSVSPYAAPARASTLRGLPPTYIETGELDLFRDEDIEYASRLMRDGVATELFVYPGAVHASDFLAPQAALSQRVVERRMKAVRRALVRD